MMADSNAVDCWLTYWQINYSTSVNRLYQLGLKPFYLYLSTGDGFDSVALIRAYKLQGFSQNACHYL
jgi:hypothetical protein